MPRKRSRKTSPPTHQGFTAESARTAFLAWMQAHNMTQSKVLRLLEAKGVMITADYLSKITRGERGPGNAFIRVFFECTGIRLVPGLVVNPSSNDSKRGNNGTE